MAKIGDKIKIVNTTHYKAKKGKVYIIVNKYFDFENDRTIYLASENKERNYEIELTEKDFIVVTD